MSGGRVVAWLKPDWQNPEKFDGLSPVTTYERTDWQPLVLQSDLAAAIARAEAAEAKLAAMEQDAREIYAQIPGLPVTPETCDAVTDVLTRFCMDFNDAIAAQQAEGEDRG